MLIKILNRKHDKCIESIYFADEENAWYISSPIIILHGAGGGQNGRYLNTEEGIIRGIQLGYKVIEIDIGITSDNESVLTHRFRPDDEVVFDHRPTLSEFLSFGAPVGETALSLNLFLQKFCSSILGNENNCRIH